MATWLKVTVMKVRHGDLPKGEVIYVASSASVDRLRGECYTACRKNSRFSWASDD